MKINNIGIFTNNQYHTNIEHPRVLFDRLFLNTRFYFVLKYIQLVFKNRKLALKGIYDRKAWALSSFDMFKLIENCGGKFHIEGFDNLRNCKEPVVIISNHMSAMESMIFPCLIAPFMEVTFVVKENLAKHFLFGPVMRARKPITVGRLNSREDFISVMKQGEGFLKEGTSVVIFPQGGRREIFKPEEFNSLGIKLAKSVGVKVIPIALKTDFWGNGKIIRDLGSINRDKPIHINIGEPVTINGSGKKENQQIIDFIASNLKIWNNLKH